MLAPVISNALKNNIRTQPLGAFIRPMKYAGAKRKAMVHRKAIMTVEMMETKKRSIASFFSFGSMIA